jgi:putative ABC transport system substrate-binding protein
MRRPSLVLLAAAVGTVLGTALVGIGFVGLYPASPPADATMPRVAIVTSGYYKTASPDWRRQQRVVGLLREHGFTADVNVTIDYWMADGHLERLPELAAAAVTWKPDVIIAVSTPAAISARAATMTIPIVTVNVYDPAQYGLVVSPEHPGGNLTGVTLPQTPANVERLSILRDLAPRTVHVGVLVDRRVPLEINPVAGALKAPQLLEAAGRLGLDLRRLDVHDPSRIDTRSGITRDVDALLVLGDPLVFKHMNQIVRLTRDAHVPSVADFGEFAHGGGLAAYSYDSPDLWRLAVEYVAKILGGASPGELPMTSSTKFHLTVNLKTAEALGLTVPARLLERADTVLR